MLKRVNCKEVGKERHKSGRVTTLVKSSVELFLSLISLFCPVQPSSAGYGSRICELDLDNIFHRFLSFSFLTFVRII